jgi:hypothetical protein
LRRPYFRCCLFTTVGSHFNQEQFNEALPSTVFQVLCENKYQLPLSGSYAFIRICTVRVCPYLSVCLSVCLSRQYPKDSSSSDLGKPGEVQFSGLRVKEDPE